MRAEVLSVAPPNPDNPFLVIPDSKTASHISEEILPLAAPVRYKKQLETLVTENRPIALVTTATREEGAAAQGLDPAEEQATVLRFQIALSLWNAGILPLVVAAGTPEEIWSYWLSQASGIVIPGGADWNPEYYDENIHESTILGSPERDQLEMKLIQHALNTNTPLFGICRGFQGIAIAAGATLLQDLPSLGFSHVPHSPPSNKYRLLESDRAHHAVQFFSSSPFSNLGAPDLPSMHHQGVAPSAQLSDILFFNGSSADGLLEAVSSSHGTIIGTQAHVEALATAHTAKERALGAEFFTHFATAMLGFQTENNQY